MYPALLPTLIAVVVTVNAKEQRTRAINIIADKNPNDEYLPIPQAEIDLNGADVLAQNPGY